MSVRVGTAEVDARLTNIDRRRYISDRDRISTAISCCDLTSLEDSDTPDKIAVLAARALRPDPENDAVPHVAALCTWPRFVGDAARVLVHSDVKVAAVAGDFPSGRALVADKVDEIHDARAHGADEIDCVINRFVLLNGRGRDVYEEVAAFRAASGGAKLKVILETGDLGDHDDIRRVALMAMAGGADMLKTSTGKIRPGATPAAVVVLADAIKDFVADTGRRVGLKVAGGIRRTNDALYYMDLVESILGSPWMTPGLFRIGASSLLDDLLEARAD